MWSIDSYQDLLDWQSSLSYEERQVSETLADLVTLAELDSIVVDKDDFTDANELIAKVKNR
jgi:ribonucleotide reductase beta subunit family protein with ferritin-like domain